MDIQPPKTDRVEQAVSKGAQAVSDLVAEARKGTNDLTPEDYMALGYVITSNERFRQPSLLYGFNNEAELPKALAYQIGAMVARAAQDQFRGVSEHHRAAFLGRAFAAAASHPDEKVRAVANSLMGTLSPAVAKDWRL